MVCPMAETIHIVIIDDHPVISHGVKSVLQKNEEMIVIGEAGTVDEAVPLVEKLAPEVVVLDISLEGADGVSLIKRLHQASPASRIVMYTMHAEAAYVSRSLRGGALGYILKSDRMAELISAVRAVSQGKIYLSGQIPATVLQELLTGSGEGYGGVDSLTSREYEIAALLAQGLRPEEIGRTLCISPKTVRVHRANIMRKFNCAHVHELLLQLRQHFPQ